MPERQPPAGFQWRALADLARLETGHTPSRRHPEYWGGDIPWIGIRDATANHGRLLSYTAERITAEGETNSSTRLLPAETVCLSRTASVGYVVVMGTSMATSQDFVNWVCGPELDYRYLKYILMAERAALLRFATGTTHQTVYFPEVKAFHVLIPGLSEQRAIADMLGALDDRIESNRRVVAKLAELASAVLQSQDRTLRQLGDVAAVTMGSSPPGDTYNNIGAGLPFYQGVRDFGFRFPALRVWCSAPVRIAQAGNTLISVRAPVGRVNRAREMCCIGRGVASAQSSTPSTVYYALEAVATAWEPYHSEGTVFGAIGRDDLVRLPLMWPTRSADALEAVLAPLDARLDSASVETASLTALRDALIPALLSGRLRVPEARAQLEAIV